jgi:uncharacterized protein (TIGR02996 family)
MSHEDAFLRAIDESPDDEGLRLVFADWLEEENGDPGRAEFIRVQCEAGRLPVADFRRRPLQRRARELLTAHRWKWTAPLRDWCSGHQFRRGLVEEVTVEALALLDQHAELFRLGPVRRLGVKDVSDLLPLLAESAALSRPDRLNVWSQLRLADLALLAASPRLKPGPVLGLAPANGEVAAWAASPHLERVTALYFANTRIPLPAAQALAASPHARNITELDLSNTFIDLEPESLEALVTSPNLANLRSLHLTGERSLNNMGALRTLAAAPAMANLRLLNLDGCNLVDATAFALANSPHLGRLTELWARGNYLTEAGVLALANSPHLRSLAVLDLGGYERPRTPQAREVLRQRFGAGLLLGDEEDEDEDE